MHAPSMAPLVAGWNEEPVRNRLKDTGTRSKRERKDSRKRERNDSRKRKRERNDSRKRERKDSIRKREQRKDTRTRGKRKREPKDNPVLLDELAAAQACAATTAEQLAAAQARAATTAEQLAAAQALAATTEEQLAAARAAVLRQAAAHSRAAAQRWNGAPPASWGSL